MEKIQIPVSVNSITTKAKSTQELSPEGSLEMNLTENLWGHFKWTSDVLPF